MESPSPPTAGQLQQTLVDLAVDSWRFSRLFLRALDKMDAGESSRFVNQYRFYLRRLDLHLGAAGVHIVNVEGLEYDPGIAATALNIGDFGPEDTLLVDQMIEPILMGPEGLARAGTIMLRKSEE